MNQTPQKNEENPILQPSLSSLQTDGDKSKLSLVIAMNRLKQTQDRIYQVKKRLQIMHMRQSSFEYRNMHRSQARQNYNQIRNFADNQKSIKNKNLLRRSFQVQRSHQMSMQKRRNHKQRVQNIKQQIQRHNRSNYEQSKYVRQKHEKAISDSRNQHVAQRKSNRQKLYDEQQKRKTYLKEYLRNKELTTRLRKEEETFAVQSRILQNQATLQKLEKMGSEASQANFNPESRQISEDNKQSIERKNNDEKRGFRVKYYKNQPVVLLE